MGDFNQEVCDALYPPPPAVSSRAHVKSIEQYRQMYDESVSNPEKFFGDIAREFYWNTPFSSVGPSFNFARSRGPIRSEWFLGGRTNMAYNCLDRHISQGKGGQVAFHYESNDVTDAASRDFTYQEVHAMVCQCANALKNMGIGKGDRVTIYLPMVVQLPVAMLACARIGAIHSVVFGGFSADSLAGRILDAQSRVLITADGVMRGAKPIMLKKIADAAVESAAQQGFQVQKVINVLRLNNQSLCPYDWTSRDVTWADAVSSQSTTCPCEWVESEDPLFMLYTSGSTGKPKGVVHTTAGYMIGAKTTFKYTFDYLPGDVFWCTADCGWITGHTYLTYGPMLEGARQVLFEGVPTHPTPGRFWEVVDKYSVTQFYTAPTAIRSLMRAGDAPVKSSRRTSLRLLGTVGEPINPAAWEWYHKVVGDSRCPIVDTYWQTETGSHLLTPLPGATALKPGSATLPFFGIVPVIVDDKGNELQGECAGKLMIKKSFPSMMRTVYGDHERFEKTYFSELDGYYFTGDGCKRDKDGYYFLTGRMDDVINVSGHRIGTAEVESALVQHPKVAEAAVVGFPHDIKGEGIYCYVSLMEGEEYVDSLKKDLIAQVRSMIGAFAAPDVIHWAPGLPKTRSGKIMRRILRKLALPTYATEDLGDTSTLADPSVVETLKQMKPGASSTPAPAGGITAAGDDSKPVVGKPPNPHVTQTCTSGPIGLTAFGVTTILLNFLNAELIGADTITLIICYGMFHGGMIQVLAGMWEVYRGNIFGGCAFTTYGGFWMGFALFEILMVVTTLDPPSKDGKAVWLFVWGVFTTLMFMGTLNANRAVQFVFASLALLFYLLCLGVYIHKVHILAGYVGIVCGSSALYLGWAEVMNELAGRELCPIYPVVEKWF